jgi:hypothetical protein
MWRKESLRHATVCSMQLVTSYCLSVIVVLDYTWSFPTNFLIIADHEKCSSGPYITTG